MEYIYKEKDLDKISWERMDKYIEKIYKEVNKFILENSLEIKYIVPILRGGAIPAVILAHKFNIVDFLPVQYKYGDETYQPEEKFSLDIYPNVNIKENECILLVEGNHVTGKTAMTAKERILEKFGKETKIVYVSITRDYSDKDSVQDVIYTTCGFYTNEQKNLSKKECEKLNIDYTKVSVYPWENVQGELKELNK